MRKVEGWCGGGFGGWVCGWRWVLGWVGLEWSERGEELIPERILLRRLSHVDLVLVTVFYTLGLVSFRVVPKIRYCMSLSPLRQPPKASKSLQHTKTPKPNNPNYPILLYITDLNPSLLPPPLPIAQPLKLPSPRNPQPQLLQRRPIALPRPFHPNIDIPSRILLRGEEARQDLGEDGADAGETGGDHADAGFGGRPDGCINGFPCWRQAVSFLKEGGEGGGGGLQGGSKPLKRLITTALTMPMMHVLRICCQYTDTLKTGTEQDSHATKHKNPAQPHLLRPPHL